MLQDPKNESLTLSVPDLMEAVDYFTNRLGFRLHMILPADAPKLALISGQGVTMRLEAEKETQSVTAPDSASFIISRMNTDNAWHEGRVEMQYRDLIPSRLDGRFIASHIRIPDGGATSDYVHYHKVGFQIIYCKTGWVRVVYEDQGGSFLMQAGDCVLQPPEIRHRVLEASPGLEVIEVSSPAVHETWVDHEMQLPTRRVLPQRLFGNQQFLLHRASTAEWKPWKWQGFEISDSGIATATDGLASVRFIRANTDTMTFTHKHTGDFLFYFILQGEADFESLKEGHHPLQAGDSCVIPAGSDFRMHANAGMECMEVSLPATLR